MMISSRGMRRQRAAIDLPPARHDFLLASRAVVLGRGVSRRERLLHILQRQRELLGIEPLGTAAKACRCNSLMIAVNRSSSSAWCVRSARSSARTSGSAG